MSAPPERSAGLEADRDAERALAALPNLGPASARMLVAAGFRSRADLERAGAAFVFRAVQYRYDGPRVGKSALRASRRPHQPPLARRIS